MEKNCYNCRVYDFCDQLNEMDYDQSMSENDVEVFMEREDHSCFKMKKEEEL